MLLVANLRHTFKRKPRSRHQTPKPTRPSPWRREMPTKLIPHSRVGFPTLRRVSLGEASIFKCYLADVYISHLRFVFSLSLCCQRSSAASTALGPRRRRSRSPHGSCGRSSCKSAWPRTNTTCSSHRAMLMEPAWSHGKRCASARRKLWHNCGANAAADSHEAQRDKETERAIRSCAPHVCERAATWPTRS